MDIVLIIVAILLAIFGIIGSFLPVLPGPPLAFIGMAVMQFTELGKFSENTLWAYGLFALAITILDYFLPAFGTKKFGGTIRGTSGANWGVFIGVFATALPPFFALNLLLFPFFGALIGELSGGREFNISLKAAFGSFLGFLLGTFTKVILSVVILVKISVNAWEIIKHI